MAHDIRVIPARDFLRADVHGSLDLAASKQLLAELAAACVGRRDQHILIDTRDTADPVLSSTDLFELVQALRKVGLGLLNRIAILRRRRSAFDRARFFEMLAHERGLQVGAFDDFEAAFDWLNGSPPHPAAD
ncbi:MAG TPA: hypothetical protein VGF55_25825 [Gemmataceae bacterium]|jgi:hypothetical protein